MASQVSVTSLNITYTRSGSEPTVAIEDLDLDIPAGTFLSIVGPSGCGKTTLLKSIAGLVPATRGEIRIGDEPLTGPRADTGIMFQAPTLLPWLTVLKNVLLPIKIKRKVTQADKDNALRLLDRAGLAGFEKSLPNQLSGGMQQRVSLCRALGTKPSLLLLDEPFGALDAMTRDQMNLDLHNIWAADAPTTILITHSISEAVFLSQKIVVMSSRPGRVLDVIDVPLPDRRDASVMEMPEFASTSARIRAYFTEGAPTHASA
ncbi:ABC transporter ATP-binding protein [Nocardioides sp. cx-173]|uniref:ABC transporter ATP-binding protein n=1 Tax=Nocardioides sp. cx-173 TaxID=2898796 RepID=UPI001E46D9B9|nr:ABC transporter ATP-binding protein [Nocardioides sp. cx-173]MCD4527058.1 ABC transporter ATP-binding protein [Nocardioides sp. cx-173]UGB41010.1 ABC transporter ATP-binding protein [Nocardioides sp. cx-173]